MRRESFYNFDLYQRRLPGCAIFLYSPTRRRRPKRKRSDRPNIDKAHVINSPFNFPHIAIMLILQGDPPSVTCGDMRKARYIIFHGLRETCGIISLVVACSSLLYYLDIVNLKKAEQEEIRGRKCFLS